MTAEDDIMTAEDDIMTAEDDIWCQLTRQLYSVATESLLYDNV